MKTAPSKPFKALGSALRVAREVAGLTQEEASTAMGMGQTQLSRYESGMRQAPIHVVRKAEAVYEQIILIPGTATGVARETPHAHKNARTEERRTRGYYEGLMSAASRISALAAEMMQEANQGLDR